MQISGEEAFRSYALAVSGRNATLTRETSSASTLDSDLSLSDAVTSSVSQKARDIQLVKSALNQLPDVREDRIAELKAQIDSGTYHVSGEDIADLIVRRAFADSTNL